MEYARRLVDNELDDLFPGIAAISLDGAKGVGKTATASERVATILRMDTSADAELIRAAPEQLAAVTKPVLIDEWQRLPEVWDRVRRLVDENSQGGQFLLTGSAAPAGASIHSGAGRIVSLRMRPLSIAERNLDNPTVSLAQLAEGVQTPIDGTTSIALADYVREIMASGFPGIRELSPRQRREQLDGYIARVIDKEFAEQGQRVRRPATLRAWLAAYAAATASTASYITILDAATPGQSNKPTIATTTTYRDVLSQLWLLDEVPAWSPVAADFTRLGSTSKHFLADPALAARLLQLREDDLIDLSRGRVLGPQEGTILGRLFEALVALSLQTYARLSECTVSHLRTRNGDHEVDFIVHRGAACVALEVKLGATVDDFDVRHLLWLKQQLGENLRDMVVVNTGARAYRRTDGVAVVPAALLGA
ncbi:MAG: ATP-binding protein [Rhodoglobus sp.]